MSDGNVPKDEQADAGENLTEQFGVKVSPEVFRELRAVAGAYGWKVGKVARDMIKEALPEWKAHILRARHMGIDPNVLPRVKRGR